MTFWLFFNYIVCSINKQSSVPSNKKLHTYIKTTWKIEVQSRDIMEIGIKREYLLMNSECLWKHCIHIQKFQCMIIDTFQIEKETCKL